MLLGNKQKQKKTNFFFFFLLIDHRLILSHKRIIKNHVSDSQSYKNHTETTQYWVVSIAVTVAQAFD